jgi:DNA polymerase III subunit beta
MKFATSSQEILKSLSRVIGVVPTKTTIPILENILFELEGNNLRLTATDIDIAMSVTLEVKASKDGRLAVPAKRFFDTIKALPDIDFTFSADTNFKITLKTPNGEYKLTGESADDYPSLPAFKHKSEITLDGEILRGLINRASFSVSSDELRPSMTGVLFHIKEDELRTVATDGHRLVRIITKNIELPKTSKEILVSAKTLHLVLKSISGQTKINFDEKLIKFDFGNGVLISKLIDEQYPNYEAVIPIDYESKLIINRNEMLSSVRRVSIYSSSTTRQVKFAFNNEEMVISAQDFDIGGEAKETIACECTGEGMEIGFNSNYIIDVLGHLECESAMIEYSSPIKATIFRPMEKNENEDILMIVMPVRLSN